MEINTSVLSISNWLNSYQFRNNSDKPQVILSYAVSLDGCIAYEKGKPFSISCRESVNAVHEIRSYCDAILIGVGTLLSDNPRLTVRYSEGENPLPVVLDTNLRTPPDAEIFKSGTHPVIFCKEHPEPGKKEILETCGAVVKTCKYNSMGISLEHVLKYLFKKGCRSIMVEGGGEVLSSFLHDNLWDRMAVTVTPSILGGYNFYRESCSDIKFENCRWMNAGNDCICLIERSKK